MKKIAAILLSGLILSAGLSGCYKVYTQPNDSSESFSAPEEPSSSAQPEESESTKESAEAEKFLAEKFPTNGAAELLNFRTVQEGEEIAVIKTNMGEMKVMFFPEAAPLAVENFKALIQKGYYNTTESGKMTFHKVVKDFMIQAGDPTGTGAGGESASGEPFADEFSERALHFKGALSMVNSGANTNESQFFIVQAPPEVITDELWDVMKNRQEIQKAFPQSVMDKYAEVGGTPWLDFDNTVFGQVYEGLDVLDAIAGVAVDERYSKPVEDVIIESITLQKAPKPQNGES